MPFFTLLYFRSAMEGTGEQNGCLCVRSLEQCHSCQCSNSRPCITHHINNAVRYCLQVTISRLLHRPSFTSRSLFQCLSITSSSRLRHCPSVTHSRLATGRRQRHLWTVILHFRTSASPSSLSTRLCSRLLKVSLRCELSQPFYVHITWCKYICLI